MCEMSTEYDRQDDKLALKKPGHVWRLHLQKAANRMTPKRRQFEAMGFSFRSISVERTSILQLIADFRCICGRAERLHVTIDEESLMAMGRWGIKIYLETDGLDPAAFLIDQIGATSPEHLRKDGYSEAEIEEIQQRGRQACLTAY